MRRNYLLDIIRWWMDELLALPVTWFAALLFVLQVIVGVADPFLTANFEEHSMLLHICAMASFAGSVIASLVMTCIVQHELRTGRSVLVPAYKYLADLQNPEKASDWSGYFNMEFRNCETYYLDKVDKVLGVRTPVPVVFAPADRWRIWFELRKRGVLNECREHMDVAERAYKQLSDKEN